MTKIIIQGQGIVGQATELFLKHYCENIEIIFNDPYKDVTASDEDFASADYVVVCVNTDLNTELTVPENNSANVDAAVNESLEKGFRGKFVIRSTLGPETVLLIMQQLGQHVVFWPEFIREATWREDAVETKFVIIGGESAEQFANLFDAYPGGVFITDPMEAMIAKLSTNTFLAMKVVFANQVAQLCTAIGADYNIVKVMLENEGRIGNSHLSVPGSDGKGGYSGKCFPKDVKTFEAALIKCGIHVDLIRAISDLNEELRST